MWASERAGIFLFIKILLRIGKQNPIKISAIRIPVLIPGDDALSLAPMADSKEIIFQNTILKEMEEAGWRVGPAVDYDRERALIPEDLLGYQREAFPEVWEKFRKHNPQDPEEALARATARALDKQGTLSVLRHGFKDKGTRLRFCTFRPDHDLNPETQERYRLNRLRVVPELIYSPHNPESGRIDLVLFVNGLPVATLELKSSFKQSVENAKRQYRLDRNPKDPKTKRPEPLLSFKRGALVHFALSQDEAWMTTCLSGTSTRFLPFNRGTEDGGAGNPLPEGGGYPTEYLWREVFRPEAWLDILGRFLHLEVKESEDEMGRKVKQESMIFPRYHQWDVVTKLLEAVKREGTGQSYLVQHSAGSGKSNSIAWTAHRLSSLYTDAGGQLFDSVIVVTDRTVLDDQLQDTIYQFDHAEGVVRRINRDEGEGSKSEKLAEALGGKARIIIVTIQTFPFVLDLIRGSVGLSGRRYAVIADEAHSSQTGSSARQLKEVLSADKLDEDEELTGEELLQLSIAARKKNERISWFAFTATPKPKTIELFGRLPKPELPPSKENIPEPFHVYSMRQAIEEGFILDVLKNYTTYGIAWKLAQQAEQDRRVDSKKTTRQVNKWVRLHPYNISQKVAIVIEHFRAHVMPLLDGKGKAMLVTSSRKEAVRYKLAFDKYVREQGYDGIQAMVAFSGKVEDAEYGVEPFTEQNMNPGLKGRDLRSAFDTDEYQVMLAANKFQTGFDQPKLCAMYVDKKLAGVDCVQTLSRLNRTCGPGKRTFILDFVNDPTDILEAFLPYYRTATLSDVSDPNLIHELEDKLQAARIFEWHEVEALADAVFDPKGTQEQLVAACKPGRERFRVRWMAAETLARDCRELLADAKERGDDARVAELDAEFKGAKEKLAELDLFKKDLGSFIRYYEFISQIVDFDDGELEKLCVYARHLLPLLKIENLSDPVDLSGVVMTHYRAESRGKASLSLEKGEGGYLKPTSEIGQGKGRSEEEEWLSTILDRLNELFAGENLSDADMVNYLHTIADKVRENDNVMDQLRNNSREQALLGDFSKAAQDAILESRTAHNKQATRVLTRQATTRQFFNLVLDLLLRDLDRAG